VGQFIEKLIERFEHNKKLNAGYPVNNDFDYSELYPLLQYCINNIGDPFTLKGPFSTHEYECELIKWFLRLYSSTGDGWGYVTTGGSEGVLFGMWNGREKLKNAIVYYSEYAHYCVPKFTRLLNLDSKVIKSQANGEMDYQNFEMNLEKDKAAIVIATLGSTMTSSIDNVSKIIDILKSKNIQYYIHGDGAIDGMILPFIETDISFKLDDGIDSVSISGHKVIGAPIPCGVVLTKENHIAHTEKIEYIKDMDATITGSRSGFAAVLLWYAIKKTGLKGFEEKVHTYIEKAKRYCDIFNDNQIKAWRFKHAITVVLEQIPVEVSKKWRAPSYKNFTTLTALPKLTDEMVFEIIRQVQYYRLNDHLPVGLPTLAYPEISDDIAIKN
jgi:histidine decarboxylase